MKNILLITRQAGTVAAFEPILSRLEKKGWNYHILAFGKSRPKWEKMGYNLEVTEDFVLDNWSSYQLVLSGTSTSVRKDATYWDMAKKKDIPCIAFVDSWINYHQRFSETAKFDRTPDYIGVVDQFMKQRMIESGAPEEKLIILGHSRFDILFQKYSRMQEKGESGTSNTIVFFSDPQMRKMKNQSYASVGIETLTIFLNKYLENDAYRSDIELIIKPHPRENPEVYQKIIDNFSINNWHIETNSDAQDLICRADVVLGMNSILLIDSSKLGIPTFSIQLSENQAANDIVNRQGIQIIRSSDDIDQLINQIFSGTLKKQPVKTISINNIQKFVSFIEQIS